MNHYEESPLAYAYGWWQLLPFHQQLASMMFVVLLFLIVALIAGISAQLIRNDEQRRMRSQRILGCSHLSERWIDCPRHNDRHCFAVRCNTCEAITYSDCGKASNNGKI